MAPKTTPLHQKTKNLVWFILPLIMFSVPLFFLPITPDFFITNKTYLLYGITTLAIILYIIQSLLNKQLRFTIAPATMPLLGLSAIYIISSIMQSPTRAYSLNNSTAIIVSFTILFYILSSSIKLTDTKTIRLTILGLFTSLALVSIILLIQFTGVNQEGPVSWLQNKTFNPLGGPLMFLAFSLPLLPGLIYLSIKIKHWLTKITLFTTAALTIAGFISSISFIWPLGSNAQTLTLPFSAGWSIAVDILKSTRTILLGTGPNTFLYTFTQLRPAWLNLTPAWTVRFTNSSNELFTVITTTGIIAGTLWILFSAKTISALLRSKKRSITANFALMTLTGTFIVMLIIPSNISLYTLMFVSLILSTLYLKHQKLTRTVTINLERTNKLLSTGVSLLILIGIGVFWSSNVRVYAAKVATQQAIRSISKDASASYSHQIDAYKLDPKNPSYRINFSQTSLRLANAIAKKKNLSDQEKTNVVQLISQTIREAKNATQLNPLNVVAWENLARTYRDLINLTKNADQWSVASYQQAIKLDPTNPRIRLELGSVLLSLGDTPNAVKLFNQAIELKPNWGNAHYNLANVYKTMKDYPNALKEMRITAQLIDPKSDDYQTTQDQITELEKMVAKQAPKKTTPTKKTTKNAQPSPQRLTTPITPPVIPPTQKIDLPSDAAPEIPVTTPSPQVTPTPSAP